MHDDHLNDAPPAPAPAPADDAGADSGRKKAAPRKKAAATKKTTKAATKAKPEAKPAKKTAKKAADKPAKKAAAKPAKKTAKKKAASARGRGDAPESVDQAAEPLAPEQPRGRGPGLFLDEPAPAELTPPPLDDAGDDDLDGEIHDDHDDHHHDDREHDEDHEDHDDHDDHDDGDDGHDQDDAPHPAGAPGQPGPSGRSGRQRRRGRGRDRGRGEFHQEFADGPREIGDPNAREPDGPAPRAEMIVNYAPGEECRIAILEDGRLEEFLSEPTGRVSRVGNIYVGRVTNVESQIQAAFVDFGLDEAGFLHVSDLHPRYFPGGEGDSERVGRKTPRRERPPIQECLRRGQMIAVQVLKEGVGTKGPSVTSYLSVPGRFLVMMPEMDKVGVSRKVEDEDERRRMRKILDELDLPEGFGFILRTAGFDRTKVELDRDLDYLKRLWDDMERRRKAGGGPRLLYAESDLLLRTLRDQLAPNITRIVIDNEHAINRAAAYLRIVSPRTHASMEHYTGSIPIFHAFGIEQQLDLMHATEVPLPSGGRLIIEQTEALVAIDVNSGKSRAARDAETNALQTNLEAVDEICRQLRLRDLGGLVINDLIDMRPAANRRKVEQRFLDRLRRDRAKSTIGPISQFGILEMTRQRMRGSYEQQHFHECPTCQGRGLIARADSVASRALRELALLLEHERVRKVELVVGPRVAGSLLSTKRAAIGRIERRAGKVVEVRISEAIGPTRYSFYAYDVAGADIEIDRLPRLGRGAPPTEPWDLVGDDAQWLDAALEAAEVQDEDDDAAEDRDEQQAASLVGDAPLPGERRDDDEGDGEGGPRRKRRRRRRRGGRRGDEPNGDRPQADGPAPGAASPRPPAPAPAPTPAHDDHTPDGADDDGDDGIETDAGHEPATGDDTGDPARRKRRRRRRRRGRREDGSGDAPDQPRSDAPAPPPSPVPTAPPPRPEPAAVETVKRPRRGLYAAGRRALAPSERGKLSQE